jgi:hypothetical protein
MAKYEEATAGRLSAEAELTAAAFARRAGAVKKARGAYLAALIEWTRANEALRQHQSSHVARAGGGQAVG